MTPKVSVYITSHNYGRFVAQAIESVLHQKFTDWELIVIDDGSTDDSRSIIQRYEGRPNVRIVLQENRGLLVSSNIALRLSKGRYIVRLDADDYLEENALLVLSNILDTHPEIGLVYPDYYLVDERGDVLGVERRNKLGKEITLYDVPAHGACTLIRKSCLTEVGGYSEDFTCQDGYDLWVKFIDRFGIYNVNIPLFYYRQHGKSLTKNGERILRTRRLIQRQHTALKRKEQPFNVVGIIPVRSQSHEEAAYALRPIGGRPLIDYTIEAALLSEAFTHVVVVSDDADVLAYARSRTGLIAVERPVELARPNTPIEPTIRLGIEAVGPKARVDAFMLLYVNSPLRREHHINSAIDSMLLFDVDSVISVYEDLATHYQHVGAGLRPLMRRRTLRLEKEALWVENGAVYLSKPGHLKAHSYLGDRIGHIVMLKQESFQIDSEDDVALVEFLLTRQRPAQRTEQRGVLMHG